MSKPQFEELALRPGQRVRCFECGRVVPPWVLGEVDRLAMRPEYPIYSDGNGADYCTPCKKLEERKGDQWK